MASLALAGARAQSALSVAPGAPALPTQAPKQDDTVSLGFNRIVIARWGDAVLPNAPAFNPNPLTLTQADRQFPWDASIAALIAQAPQDGIPQSVLVLANPSAPARMVFPEGMDHPATAGRLQGATILNLQYVSGTWALVDGGYQSRRLNDGTLCEITGPVAANIGGTVQGLLAPQAGCATPWGNVLLAEGHSARWLARLSGATGFGFSNPLDAPRFGWVAELNPMDPLSFPAKRTALGHFARAGIAAASTADGHAVIFMSQDAPAGFFFRFIAATAATDGTALDSGTLAVAQIQGSSITWVNLGSDVPTLVGTLSAAANAGGSVFDAPGGIAIAPDHSGLYLACAGNPARDSASTNPLNPRAADDNGHVLVFTPPGGDLTASQFPGRLILAAGDPATTEGTQYAPGSDCWLTRPRTLNLDPALNLWIGTDQNGAVSATADGLFIMQTGGPSPFLLSLAYLAPLGAAIGGAAFDSATGSVFCPVRHPGATPSASFNFPATRWPTLRPNMPPQTTLIGLIRTI